MCSFLDLGQIPFDFQTFDRLTTGPITGEWQCVTFAGNDDDDDDAISDDNDDDGDDASNDDNDDEQSSTS